MKETIPTLNIQEFVILKRKPTSSDVGSLMYLQIGLLLCLLCSFLLLEYESEIAIIPPIKLKETTLPQDELLSIPEFKIETPKELIQQPLVKKMVTDKHVVTQIEKTEKDVAEKVIEPIDKSTITDEGITDLSPDAVYAVADNPDDDIYNIMTVSRAPVFPGCESCKTNLDLMKCFSQKINKHFNRHFDFGMVADYNMNGLQLIAVKFTVDKQGKVVDIFARSKHKILEKETLRILNKIPILKPAYQGDNIVKVAYTLPIKFKID